MLLPGVENMDLAPVLAHYDQHGYARLGRVVSDEGLELLRERALDLMRGRVSYPGMFFQLDATTGRYEDAPLGLGWQGPSNAYRKLEKLELDDRFRAFLSNPLFERIARARIDGAINLYRAILFNKGEGGGSPVPWHQDGGRLWGLSEEPELQLWTALDDALEDSGCLHVLPGTHRGGLATPLGGVVPEERTVDADSRSIALPARAGESILIHNHVWHRSGRGVVGGRRLGFSVCYLSANVRCLRKRKAPRQFFRVWS